MTDDQVRVRGAGGVRGAGVVLARVVARRRG